MGNKKIRGLAALILLALCIWGLYQIVYPFENIAEWTSREYTVIGLSIVGILLSLGVLKNIFSAKKEKKAVLEPAKIESIKPIEIRPIQPQPIPSHPKVEDIPPEPPPPKVPEEPPQIYKKEMPPEEPAEEVFAKLKTITKESKKIEREGPKMKSAFDLFEGEEKVDIISMGDKLASDFDKTVGDMAKKLDDEIERLLHDKERADKTWQNIQDTVEKLHRVNCKLENMQERFINMIKANKAIKKDLEQARQDQPSAGDKK